MSVFTNSVLNPSAEGATSSLENSTGSTVAIVATTGAGWPLDGTKSYSVTATATTAADARLRLVERAATVAGKRWNLRAKLRAAASNTGTRRYEAVIVFYNIAPGATVGSIVASATQSYDLAPGAIADVTLQGQAPTGTLSVGLIFRRVATVLGAAIGDVHHVDMVALVQSDEISPVFQYFNPQQVAFARWNGTADASTSTLWVPSILVTPFDDDDPAPRFQVVVSDMPPFANYITLRRWADDELPAIVREANHRALTGTFVVDDLETPFGIEVSYSADLYTGDVPLGTTARFTGFIPVRDPLVVYIADPLDPRSVVKGIVGEDFADDMGKVREGNFETPGGSTEGSVLLAGPSQGYTGINLHFYTNDAATTRKFKRLRDQTPLAVLRTAPPIPIPRTIYVAVLHPRSRLLDKLDGFTEWDWTSQQVIAPKVGIIVPLHSYADYMAFYSTYQAAMSIFATYLDAILNPPPAA